MPSSSLRTKMVLTFLAIALAPLGALAGLNHRATRAALIENANRALLAAANQTATSLDAFIGSRLDAVRVEAQLPDWVEYLNTAVERRKGTVHEREVEEILRRLRRKDPIHILSYALLDGGGRIVADTRFANLGQDRSDRIYFLKPVQTGLPFVSPILFSPDANEERSLYFSAPVRNASREIVGVLQAQFSASVIQQIVVEHSGMLGRGSIAILVDENRVRLAHGTTPELIGKSVIPMEPNLIEQLQREGRLPRRPAEELSTNMPDVERGLRSASSDRFSAVHSIAAEGAVYSTAITRLKSQPWTLGFVQPQEIFLAPIREQTRSAILLALVIACIVIVWALAVGHVLSAPIARLTVAARKISEGDLSVQASVDSRDEIGKLAETFNLMAVKLKATHEGLEQRIEERKKAEEALRQSEERYRDVVENIEEGIYEVDLEGKFTFFNSHLRRIFGWRDGEMMGMNFHRYLDRSDGDPLIEKFRKVLTTGVPERGDVWEIQPKAGPSRKVEVSVSLIRDSEGEPIGFRGAMRDITERLRAEEERRQLELQALHSQKLESLGILAGGIAHDFNNLLTGILGNASLVLSDLSPDDPALESLEAISASAERAAELCKQMLAYSGRGRFVIQPLDLGEVVEDMASLLEASISKKVKIDKEFANDLPPINGDATQIRQIVMNLITNASEAIGDEEGTITVSTGAIECDRARLAESYLDDELPEGRYVYLEVEDTGCGMDDETRSKIFEPFFSTKFTGRGLGLAATLGIVRGHKGALKVESEPGKGTKFRLLFPVSQDQAVSAKEPAPSIEEVESAGTVLIVDDEEILRRSAGRILERSGFNVLTARDGREGVDVFRSRSGEIDVILLDRSMPRLNGEEALAEIRQIRGDIPVVISSGYDENDATSHFDGETPTGFIQKPYPSGALVAKVREVMNARG